MNDACPSAAGETRGSGRFIVMPGIETGAVWRKSGQNRRLRLAFPLVPGSGARSPRQAFYAPD